MSTFQAAGFAALIYDNRNYGRSEGHPRFHVDPVKQAEDYHDAVTYAASLKEIDSSRIALWGTSYSAGNVIHAAAMDKRIKAVIILQVPFVSGEKQVEPVREYLQEIVNDRAEMLRKGDSLVSYVPVFADSRDQAESGKSGRVLGDLSSFKYMTTAAKRTTHWENKLTMQSKFYLAKNEPKAFIHRISPIHLLMIVAEKDAVIDASTQKAVYDLAGEPKHFHLFPDYGHFDVYTGVCVRSKYICLDRIFEEISMK